MTKPSLQNLMLKEAEETLKELFRVPLEQLEHQDILWLASKFINHYLTGYSEGLRKAREIFFEEKEARKMKCPNCENTIETWWVHCAYCGVYIFDYVEEAKKGSWPLEAKI